jgi:hypothetical protein
MDGIVNDIPLCDGVIGVDTVPSLVVATNGDGGGSAKKLVSVHKDDATVDAAVDADVDADVDVDVPENGSSRHRSRVASSHEVSMVTREKRRTRDETG